MRHFDTVSRICIALLAVLCLAGMTKAGSITILPGTLASSINAPIEAAKPGDRIMLGEGTFNLRQALVIARDGVFIAGKGRNKTILKFHIEAGDFLRIGGGKIGRPIGFAGDSKRCTTEIVLQNTNNLKAGDALYLRTPNTPGYIALWCNVK